MKKERYYDIEMEIIRFDSDDIITASLGGQGTGNPDNEEGEEEELP